MVKSKSKHSYRDIFEGIAIGGGLTGLAVFLFGTKKGKEIQNEVVKKYKKLRHRAEMSMKKLGYGAKSKKIKRKVKFSSGRNRSYRKAA